MPRGIAASALLVTALLGSAPRAEEAVLPSAAALRLSLGGSLRNTRLNADPALGQLRQTSLTGASPTFLRLDAEGWLRPWLGAELELSADLFASLGDGTRLASARGAGRVGAALRHLTSSGFGVSGAVGYGASWAPVIRYRSAAPTAASLFTHGLTARIGVSLALGRFDGALSAQLLLPLGGVRVLGLEPRLWVGYRFLDVGPTRWWLGADGGLLLEASPSYGGATARAALALRLDLLPAPAPARRPPGTLAVRALLPDGAPAVGALVAIDGAEARAVDAQGQLRVTPGDGPHRAAATLPGYRPARGSAEVAAEVETPLVLRLEALTGPGTLAGVVRAASTSRPVADAEVSAGGASLRTGAEGAYRFGAVGPGPVQVRVEAQGFSAAEEVVQVPAEGAATLDLALEVLGKGSPATVRGLVSGRGGRALKALVVIRELKRSLPVDAEGRFVVTVPGGTYSFVISAPGYVAQTKQVVLADGDQAIFHCELQKASR